MKIHITIEVKPFIVPNFAIDKNGVEGNLSVSLSLISADDLAKLCADFTRDIFKKAGKSQPPTCGCG